MNRSKTQLTRRRGERGEIQKRLPYDIDLVWYAGVFVTFWFYSASPRESIRGMIMNRSKTQLTRRRGERGEIQKRLPYDIDLVWYAGVFVTFWFYSAFSASPRESIRGLMT